MVEVFACHGNLGCESCDGVAGVTDSELPFNFLRTASRSACTVRNGRTNYNTVQDTVIRLCGNELLNEWQSMR
jgi:hypothetical protein